MPINTLIEGSPASIRNVADWLEGKLASALDSAVEGIFAARDSGERGWVGDAGVAFTSRMNSAGHSTDGLRGDVETVARACQRFADDLTTAQSGMARARGIAVEAGIAVSGDMIMEPAAVSEPTALPVNPDAELAVEYQNSSRSYDTYQMQLTAYGEAQEEVDHANGILAAAKEIWNGVVENVQAKPEFPVSDFLSDAALGSLRVKLSSLFERQAGYLKEESQTAAERYLEAPGGSAESQRLNNEMYEKWLEGDKADLQAAATESTYEGRLIPGAGMAIAAVSIGYDIHEGKPAGEAIVSGVGGAVAAIEVGAEVGAVVGGPLGVVVGAGVGGIVGVIAEGGLEWGYDHMIPEGTQNAIQGGFDVAGHVAGKAFGWL